jgi:hypothetical protein
VDQYRPKILVKLFYTSKLGDYWIRLRAIGPCNGRALEQFAVLSYSWDPTIVDTNLIATPERPKPKFSESFSQGRVSN